MLPPVLASRDMANRWRRAKHVPSWTSDADRLYVAEGEIDTCVRGIKSMSEYRAWERMDPLEVLIRKCQDCTNCAHIKSWDVHGRTLRACHKGTKFDKRCKDWRHKDAN